jgi:cytochrome c-type biogenesis protein CcmH
MTRFQYPGLYWARKILSVGLLLAAYLMAAQVFAQPRPNIPPPDLGPRVFEIARDLRCPACQGESTAESNAAIAVEMRRIIAEQLAQGRTEAEIHQFFVERYGPWILYEPAFGGLTLWAWLSPIIGLGLIGFALWRYQAVLRARARSVISEVSEEELARLESRLNQAPSEGRSL